MTFMKICFYFQIQTYWRSLHLIFVNKLTANGFVEPCYFMKLFIRFQTLTVQVILSHALLGMGLFILVGNKINPY